MTAFVKIEERPNYRRRLLALFPVAMFGAAWWSRTILSGHNFDAMELARRVVRVLGLDNHLLRETIVDASADMRIGELTEAILGEQLATAATLSDQELRVRVKHNIVADYETGRIRNIRGWILSITENNALTLAAHLRHATPNR